jgi:hypothetical protein
VTAPVTTTTRISGGAPAAPPPAASTSIIAQIAALRALDTPGLRAKYAEVFGEPTVSRNKDWLFRQVAWQIQALAEGGLSERAKRRAAELARESDVRPRSRQLLTPGQPAAGATRIVPVGPVRDPKAPLPGTVLVRDYKGRNVVVRVLEDGFEWNGAMFTSLSAVAKAVTGAHWNGHLFFGLRKAKSA